MERDIVNGKHMLKLSQLGLHQEKPAENPSPLRKYRYTIKRSKRTDKLYHVGIVLRENGKVEIYSDFMEVSQYYNPLMPCVDIETTMDDFFIKCVDNEKLMKM